MSNNSPLGRRWILGGLCGWHSSVWAENKRYLTEQRIDYKYVLWNINHLSNFWDFFRFFLRLLCLDLIFLLNWSFETNWSSGWIVQIFTVYWGPFYKILQQLQTSSVRHQAPNDLPSNQLPHRTSDIIPGFPVTRHQPLLWLSPCWCWGMPRPRYRRWSQSRQETLTRAAHAEDLLTCEVAPEQAKAPQLILSLQWYLASCQDSFNDIMSGILH